MVDARINLTRLPSNSKYWESDEELPIPKKIGCFFLRRTVGQGSFSVVKVAEHATTHELYACKIIPKRRMNSPSLEKQFLGEVEIMRSLNHPTILQIVGVLEDSINYYLFTEYCNCKDLAQHIEICKKYPEELCKEVFLHIVEGVRYLHSRNVCHRDIKPNNIMIYQDMRIKFVDFGFSKSCEELLQTTCGTCAFAAPEVLNGEKYDGKAADIWSLGVVLYVMLTGHLPWTKVKEAHLTAQIKQGDYHLPECFSDEVQTLIANMLSVDAAKRYTIEEVAASPWLVHTRRVSASSSMLLPTTSAKKFYTRSTSSCSTGLGKELLQCAKNHYRHRKVTVPKVASSPLVYSYQDL